MTNVLHTSANERDNGLILFDIVTAIGTEIEMLMIKHTMNTQTNMLSLICAKNTLKLYTKNSPSTTTQLLLSLQGHGTY